jgi:hypothetical protein
MIVNIFLFRQQVFFKVAALATVFGTLLLPATSQAMPAFARQTGQNCVACHTGGQFPELTPYGRLFKMTGYTIGTRTVPLAVMGVFTSSSVANPAPDENFKHASPIFATGSLLIGGKITDNIGAFAQVTYDPYAVDNGDGSYSGHTSADNIDVRFANHIIAGQSDWIYGVSLNNNPSVTDPWNTAAAWMQYVPVPSPSSSAHIDGAAPYPGYASDGNIAGLNAYLYWNKTVYAEMGTYRTADSALSFMAAGVSPKTQLRGSNNPYWRLALTHEWGPHNIMVGASGMVAHLYDDPADISDPSTVGTYRNAGFDAQYQYILNPHTFTAQLAHMKQETNYSEAFNAGPDAINPGLSDTNTVTRAKLAYTYQAKYGGSLSLFNLTGSTNNQSDPATRGITYEAFFIPKQNVRLGVQYTTYSSYDGAGTNYDGFGRNASDNNSMFLYAWFAY